MTPRIRSKTSSGTASTLRMRRSTMLAVSENDSSAGRSLESTATPSESTLRDDGAADLHGLVRPSAPIPSEHRGPLLGAVLAQQNGGAVGRRHFEDRFEHLLFQRFQAPHRVHRFADAEQGIQIADGPAGGLMLSR